MIGDTYNFSYMGYTAKSLMGESVTLSGDTITAKEAGVSTVILVDNYKTKTECKITVYENAKDLGGKFPLDRGMFGGKKLIVFGDSITDGEGCDRDRNYFAKLCQYLGSTSDPTDTCNINLALGGSTVTYPGGVVRASTTELFTDPRGERDPYPNILDADLCVIYYGTNDFSVNAYSKAPEGSNKTDNPTKAEDAVTVKGAFNFMVDTMRTLNPVLKFLLLPPLFRGDYEYWESIKHNFVYNDEGTDVQNLTTKEYLSDFATAIEEVAMEKGARFVNWFGIFTKRTFTKYSIYSDDGCHPNESAHKVMFEYLISQF